MKDPKKKLFGLILNGGLSRRMGTDKSKKLILNKPLISLVFERAKVQVDYLAINSNQKSFDKCNEINQKPESVIFFISKINIVSYFPGYFFEKRRRLASN